MSKKYKWLKKVLLRWLVSLKVMRKQYKKSKLKTKVKSCLDETDINDDNEEKETQTLKGQDLKQGRNWYLSKLK